MQHHAGSSSLPLAMGLAGMLLLAALPTAAVAQQPGTETVNPRLKAQAIASVNAQSRKVCAERKAGTTCALSGTIGKGTCQPLTECAKRTCKIVLACAHTSAARADATGTHPTTNADLEARLGPTDTIPTSKRDRVRTSVRHQRILTERPAPDPRLTRVTRARNAGRLSATPDPERAQARFFNRQVYARACAGKKAKARCAVAGLGAGSCTAVAVCKGDSCSSHLRCDVARK